MAQMKMSSSIEENFEKTIKFMNEAAEKNADIICFPEIQLTPFFPQYQGKDVTSYVIDIESDYIKRIGLLCQKLKLHAAPNFYIEENGKRYDMTLLIDDNGIIIGKQKMVHIAQCEKFYEQDYYTPSEEGFQVFDTRFGKIGIVVCFDRYYPESIRTEVLRGAELIIIPTANFKDEPSELFQWEVKIQAFQNSVNIAMCNRVGIEDQMEFSGESIVADYNGESLAVAGDKEELIITQINLSEATNERKRKPYTSLRRKDLYE
ncbi:hypothetical protein PIROE2DRAFT_63972 [Piromyces sp. E2]|nr:hypothetical protein PIROE2DRAFT_63972 [Piromyces sp. E2]|eukprot:OUM59127.1 hypothetical protein PIROE2DRAFT_63972 [Piromyces sp. E2]